MTSVWPLFGPMSGGTRLTILGQWLDMYPVTQVDIGLYYRGQFNTSDRYSKTMKDYIRYHCFTLCVASHRVSLRYITLRYLTLRYVPLHYKTLRYVTLRYRNVMLRYLTTLRYVTLQRSVFRYVMLRCDTLRYTTLN